MIRNREDERVEVASRREGKKEIRTMLRAPVEVQFRVKTLSGFQIYSGRRGDLENFNHVKESSPSLSLSLSAGFFLMLNRRC